MVPSPAAAGFQQGQPERSVLRLVLAMCCILFSFNVMALNAMLLSG